MNGLRRPRLAMRDFVRDQGLAPIGKQAGISFQMTTPEAQMLEDLQYGVGAMRTGPRPKTQG